MEDEMTSTSPFEADDAVRADLVIFEKECSVSGPAPGSCGLWICWISFVEAGQICERVVLTFLCLFFASPCSLISISALDRVVRGGGRGFWICLGLCICSDRTTFCRLLPTSAEIYQQPGNFHF